MRLGPEWVGVALLCGLSFGCGESRDGVPVSVVDSADIEIVTNPHSFAEVPLRTISDEFIHKIAEEALYQIRGIQPLPGGRLAVAVNGEGSVLLYDSAGERIATLGRTGDGPGEFRSVGSPVPLPGDSLGVYDSSARRFTVFPLDSGVPRVVSLAEIAPGRGWARIRPLTAGLVFVGEAGLGGVPNQGVYRNQEESYRIDSDGQVLATYGTFPGMEAFAGSGMMGRAPFGALLATATWQDQLIVGTGEEPELRFFRPDGSLSRIIRWADTDRTVTAERMNQHIEFLLEQVPPEQESTMRERLQGMPHAPRMPTHSEVLVSPEGVIWVGEYPGPEAELPTGRASVTRRWVVFGSDGVIRERIQTPTGFMPMSLGEDLVWGVYHNDLDVESVRAYRVGSSEE